MNQGINRLISEKMTAPYKVFSSIFCNLECEAISTSNGFLKLLFIAHLLWAHHWADSEDTVKRR